MYDEESGFPGQALNAAINAARLAEPTLEMGDGRTFAFMPESYQLRETTDPHRLPGHIDQAVCLDDRASLVSYTNRFSDTRSILIADYDAGTIASQLDWHRSNNDDEPGREHTKHTATLKLRDSEEYARWNQMEGEMHSQADFALFIEENVADVLDPDHSVLLEICRDLEATQGVKFRSGVRLDNGDRSFTYEDETHVKNDMTVPTEITLQIPLYFGEEPAQIRAKFRFRPTANGLLLGFRWHRVEYMRQAKFQEMAVLAADETGLPVFFGRR